MYAGLHFAQMAKFSGLGLFNEPENPRESQLEVPLGGFVLRIFKSWTHTQITLNGHHCSDEFRFY